MNHTNTYDETSTRIRSVDFAMFEKPTAKPHWSFDETQRTRARRSGMDLNAALRALQALAERAARR